MMFLKGICIKMVLIVVNVHVVQFSVFSVKFDLHIHVLVSFSTN